MSQKLIAVIAPSALVVGNIFFFGPFNIYKGNISEFAISLSSILALYLLPALALLSILIGTGLLLPSRLHRRYVSIIFLIGVLIWLQGNILVWKYGLLDGQAFDWTKGLWRGWIDSSLWLVLLFLGFVLYERIYNVVMWGSIALISLQAVFVVFNSFQNTENWGEKEFGKPTSLPQEICEFSAAQNVIQIILDGFQSNIFDKIIKKDLEYYQKALEGFTFFRGATGSFPTTRMSIPAILSGKNYKNDIPMPDFIRAVYQGKTITNVAHDSGYEVDFIGAIGFSMGKFLKYSNIYALPIPYGVTRKEYGRANAALMLDLVLFRSAPHFLKKYIYNNQAWLLQGLLDENEFRRTFFGAYTQFLEDFIEKISVSRNRAVYKYIHLMSSHPPFVVNADCKYAGNVLTITTENAIRQDKCVLDQVIMFLDKLEKAGIYESSLIILQADHGVGLDVDMVEKNNRTYGKFPPSVVVGGALPLLAIKPPYSKGTLKVSEAQVTLTDIPATISSLLNIDGGLPGLSAFKVAPTLLRERRYYRYKWRNEHWQADFFPRLDEYIIKGSVFDRASWERGLTYYPPGETSFSTTKIDFGTPKSDRFKRFGWGGNESPKGGYSFNWSLGCSASISVSLPKDKPVILTANIQSYPFDKPQHVTIKVDGKEIGSWELRPPWHLSKHSIVIEPKEDSPDVSVLEFIFSQHRIEEVGKRPVAVRFESITLGGAKSLK